MYMRRSPLPTEASLLHPGGPAGLAPHPQGLPPGLPMAQGGVPPGMAPQAPPAAPQAGMHPAIPWLLMAALQGAKKQALHTPQAEKLEHAETQPKVAKAYVKTTKEDSTKLPGSHTQVASPGAGEKSPGPASDSSSLSGVKVDAEATKPLSLKQMRSKAHNPPIQAPGVTPMDREADTRDETAAVPRSVDTTMLSQNKRSGLVDPGAAERQSRYDQTARIKKTYQPNSGGIPERAIKRSYQRQAQS